MTDDPAELVRRAQGGDSAAFSGLVRLYARLVWAVVASELRDPGWTEDLVQETFFRAFKSIDQLSTPAAFKPWLLTIARRLAWRHRQMDPGIPLEGEEGRRSEPARSLGAPPASSRDPEETRLSVHTALARLPERERIPVTLRYLNGLSYGEISKQLGLSDGALRGLLSRGVKRLKKELASTWKGGLTHES